MRSVIIIIICSAILFNFGFGAQIDTVVLDELLQEIVDSSMSELRHRLQEAVFATSFRRKILGTSEKGEKNPKNLENLLLDDYLKPQKLALSLETYTSQAPPTTTTVIPVKLVTADDVAISAQQRVFKDDVANFANFSDKTAEKSIYSMPRVPVYVAVTVIAACILTFVLLVGTVIYFLTNRWKETRMKMDLGVPQGRILDPLSVQGLSTCHVNNVFPGSRRSSLYLDQDRATSSIWAHP